MTNIVPLLPANCAASRDGNVLIVEDRYQMPQLLAETLAREGYSVRTLNSREYALNLCCRNTIHLILMDHNMAGMSTELFVQNVRLCSPHTSLVLISACDSIVEDARILEIDRCFRKPVNLDALVIAVAEMLNTFMDKQPTLAAENADNNV